MIDYGTVESTISPQELVVDEDNVWIASDIQVITRLDEISDTEVTLYTYDLKRYDKDEYLQILAETSESQSALLNALLRGN